MQDSFTQNVFLSYNRRQMLRPKSHFCQELHSLSVMQFLGAVIALLVYVPCYMRRKSDNQISASNVKIQRKDCGILSTRVSIFFLEIPNPPQKKDRPSITVPRSPSFFYVQAVGHKYGQSLSYLTPSKVGVPWFCSHTCPLRIGLSGSSSPSLYLSSVASVKPGVCLVQKLAASSVPAELAGLASPLVLAELDAANFPPGGGGVRGVVVTIGGNKNLEQNFPIYNSSPLTNTSQFFRKVIYLLDCCMQSGRCTDAIVICFVVTGARPRTPRILTVADARPCRGQGTPYGFVDHGTPLHEHLIYRPSLESPVKGPFDLGTFFFTQKMSTPG